MAVILGPNGNPANVSDSGSLQVAATSQNLAEALNFRGAIYSANGLVTPAGAGDYFFYLKNIGTSDISVSLFSFSSSQPTEIKIDHVSGTPVYVGEVAAEVTNLNLGSSNSLPAIANIDTSITGLINVGQLLYEECAVAETRYTQNIASAVIVPQGKAIGVRRMAATGEINFSIGMGVFPS